MSKTMIGKFNRIRLFYMVSTILLIFFSTINFIRAGMTQEEVKVQDYVEEKFDSHLFQLFFKSLGELDSQEREFLNLLSTQPRNRQVFYGKKVYQDGFGEELLSQLQKEIGERESITLPEEKVDNVSLPLPTLPSMKLWERMYVRMVSMQKVITTIDYNRFAICGVDPSRSERVVKRVKNYFDWCKQWMKEGREVESLAEQAQEEGNIFLARRLFHEAAGCYHIGAFINYYNVEEKVQAQEAARKCYTKAIALYEEQDRPVRIEIPFRGVEIPGYLMLSEKPGQPLLIFVNVLNNIKEVENHFFAQDFLKAGFNVFNFDGPGQGEMHQKMRLIPDYEQAIITIIDWFENNNTFSIDIGRIGVIGMSFGGLSSIIAAALDSRIDCVVSNGGYAYFPPLSHIKKLSIPTRRSVYYMTGLHSMKEISDNFGHIDIRNFAPLERPMLIIQGGKDKTVPPEHAYYFMEWAIGKDKELLYFEDSGHCCQDRFDIVIPYTIDWFRKHLFY